MGIAMHNARNMQFPLAALTYSDKVITVFQAELWFVWKVNVVTFVSPCQPFNEPLQSNALWGRVKCNRNNGRLAEISRFSRWRQMIETDSDCHATDPCAMIHDVAVPLLCARHASSHARWHYESSSILPVGPSVPSIHRFPIRITVTWFRPRRLLISQRIIRINVTWFHSKPAPISWKDNSQSL